MPELECLILTVWCLEEHKVNVIAMIEMQNANFLPDFFHAQHFSPSNCWILKFKKKKKQKQKSDKIIKNKFTSFSNFFTTLLS